jgi:hypothetical protein
MRREKVWLKRCQIGSGESDSYGRKWFKPNSME